MKISIIGSGSWGTALAQVLADNQHEVKIWGKNLDELVDITVYHQNEKYFPGIKLNESIQAVRNFEDILPADYILLAVPSEAIEEVCESIDAILQSPVTVINVAKGFNPNTHERLSQTIQHTFKSSHLKAVVSLIGPSHAEEVVLRQLTVVNAVCEDEEAAKEVQNLFSNAYFRVYRNTDVVGAEIGVAVKNVIALASGIISGLGLGDNARAALMTRGMAEITRYGLTFGAKPETFLGLTGMGDLIVTCTSVHSRNFQAGLGIGKNNSSALFWENNTKTVEGVKAAKVVYEDALKLGIPMPITEAVYAVLYKNAIPSEVIETLMKRELKSEETR